MKGKRGRRPIQPNAPLTERLVIRISRQMFNALHQYAGKGKIGLVVRNAIQKILSENQ